MQFHEKGEKSFCGVRINPPIVYENSFFHLPSIRKGLNPWADIRSIARL